jgi:hypothetical protein
MSTPLVAVSVCSPSVENTTRATALPFTKVTDVGSRVAASLDAKGVARSMALPQRSSG